MRFPGFVAIGALLILGLISHGIVLMQLSHNPERGHRGPAETFRASLPGESEWDSFHPTAAVGLELVDPRAW